MPTNTFIRLWHFRRHLKYHKDIIKHLRWTRMDALRLDFYRSLIQPGTLVFDVGANMGYRSRIFRALGARVVAFEPQSYCAAFLSAAFSGDSNYTLRKMALSHSEGQMTMHLSDAHVLSSLDGEWMERMNQGGRFAHRWNRTEEVSVSTLNHAIAEFGIPEFIKIDVEGHELSVLHGLSQPVKLLSLEFASESLDRIQECVGYLETLGSYEFRISLGESMHFESNKWLDAVGIKLALEQARDKDPLVWGDIYAKRVD